MASYLWGEGDLPALGSLASTTRLSDNLSGDTATGESVTDSETFGAGCAYHEVAATLTAVCDLGSAQDITGWAFTATFAIDSGDNQQCNLGFGDPIPAGPVQTARVYTSDDGSAWTLRASPTVALGANTESGSLSVNARYVAVVVVSYLEFYDQDDTIGASVTLTDFRATAGGGGNPCGLPTATQELPRGTRRAFVVNGATAPTVDAWEIYRCVNSALTLIDSSDLGDSGFEGWMVERSTEDGKDYDIYAPPNAEIADDYECRIDDSGGPFSINFNVTSPTDEDTTMAERPRVFEKWQFGIEGTAGTAVVPNKKSQLLGMAPPNPMEPGQVVFQPGDRAAVEVISQKRHTEAQITGPMGFPDQVYVNSSLLHSPFVTTPGGATLARDYIFMPRADADDVYKTFTNETGNSDFPARADFGNINNGTMTFGKTENTFDGTMVMQALNETLNSFANSNPEYIPLIPIAAKDNSYFLGTPGATFGTLSQLCDTQNFTFTLGTRRTPHFTQCSTEESYTTMMPVADAEMLATFQLSHKSASRNMVTNLRNRDTLWFRVFNQGPVIEGSLRYEFEMIMPCKLRDPATGDSDGATARTYTLQPILDRTFNPFAMGTPGGYVAVRIRAKSTDVSMAAASAI